MAWTGMERCMCFCGMPAVVKLEEDGAFLLCFAHSRESGLFAPMPSEKPDDFSEQEFPLEEIRALSDAGDKQHPTLVAFRAHRARMYELVKQGFLEAHPCVGRYVALYTADPADQAILDPAWDELDEEEQDFVRGALGRAPAWREDA